MTLRIQNAHNGRDECVVVHEGRCGTVAGPMSRAEARQFVRNDQIPLKEEELSQLIRLSLGRGFVSLYWGVGGAALSARSSPWALPFLAEMHGVGALPSNAAPECNMCDDTGYKDYAGFAMDQCDHQSPLTRLTALDEELEEQHPGWMTGKLDRPHCTRCNETLASDQTVCPFCDAPAVDAA